VQLGDERRAPPARGFAPTMPLSSGAAAWSRRTLQDVQCTTLPHSPIYPAGLVKRTQVSGHGPSQHTTLSPRGWRGKRKLPGEAFLFDKVAPDLQRDASWTVGGGMIAQKSSSWSSPREAPRHGGTTETTYHLLRPPFRGCTLTRCLAASRHAHCGENGFSLIWQCCPSGSLGLRRDGDVPPRSPVFPWEMAPPPPPPLTPHWPYWTGEVVTNDPLPLLACLSERFVRRGG